jgi:Uncharacterized protein conserved in bacteria
MSGGLQSPIPPRLAHDLSQSRLGFGTAVFECAKQALIDWKMFDLGWVRVVNPSAGIAIGETIAVEAVTLGLWTLNLSRIVETTDLPHQFGFIYATTKFHVETGEERFLLEFNPSTGEVCYGIEAVSRPSYWPARVALPVSRTYQHKFSRDSHRRLGELIP